MMNEKWLKGMDRGQRDGGKKEERLSVHSRLLRCLNVISQLQMRYVKDRWSKYPDSFRLLCTYVIKRVVSMHQNPINDSIYQYSGQNNNKNINITYQVNIYRQVMKKLLNQWKKDGQVKQWAEKGLQGIHERAIHYIYTQPRYPNQTDMQICV